MSSEIPASDAPSSAPAPAPEPSLADRITRDEAEEEDEEAAIPQNDGADRAQNGSGLEEPEYEVEVQLNDLQQDPNNPLFSIKTFEEIPGLSQELLKGILNMNFRKPSKIQERALPLLLRDPPQNLIGQSQSGTGKTAAFTLNILTRIDISLQQPQALVLAPSRELARQIQGVIKHMGSFMPGLETVAAIPDPTRRGKITAQVVVGTPGTVQDWIKKRVMDVSKMKVMVLDEADNMLDQQGLGDQCRRVRTLLPRNMQIVLFSATFPDQVLDFAKSFAPDANMITLKQDELTVEGIKQFYFDCDNEEAKYDSLVKFYGLLTINSSIIFCKKRDTAVEIERRMKADGHEVAHLSGALEGIDRDAVIDRFRNGLAKVLITTNVLARGIDVQSVTMVVNYDIPEMQRGQADPETYLHRIGRTGRFGRVGVAISFISSTREHNLMNDIVAHFGVEMSRLSPDNWDDVESQVKRVIKSGRAGKSTKEMQSREVEMSA
ncbi:DEAD-domain-containing protein [Tothia fuscella]|uniref:RNA helicase n=1 Tax=Tothia fuscella TaxID=1048955 RepID=A0A9P4TVV6_9PEZI|nr:DEAD-domain-containing protein [Tothia fuscella]